MVDILLPLLFAYVNHYWRGQGKVPRWVFYSFMFFQALVLTFDYIFAVKWLVFMAGYAVLPWQAMFSAIHGEKPGRKDNRFVQWMQTATERTGAQGRTYGVVYGAFRALPMLPGIILLGDWWGLLFVGMGGIYYLCGLWSIFWTKSYAIAVGLAEIVMGYFIGHYFLSCCRVAGFLLA